MNKSLVVVGAIGGDIMILLVDLLGVVVADIVVIVLVV